ncbi:hypothetical protein [Cupriavidus sp. TMH.W2]|uniref:hypothetical protein n=1 Tax=Cupriavidus sp. TMH.W2 TaxID=3434465 RepID=UPI003D772195
MSLTVPVPHWQAHHEPDACLPSSCSQPTELRLSGREINFLWWFIQGSIMDAEVRRALRRAWGFCPRHMAGWLLVEAAFRGHYLHGPAVLFDDLMGRAASANVDVGPMARRRLVHQLRAYQPCYLCGMGLSSSSHGYVPESRLEQGRNCQPWCDFMGETYAYWQPHVCGICAGSSAIARCRQHLCADLSKANVTGFTANRQLIQEIARHVHCYNQSFSWEHRGNDRVEDRAALVSAAGWCSGWQALLVLPLQGRK